MAHLFEHAEISLGRAGWVLLLEFSAAIAAGFVLSNVGMPPEFAVLALWLLNPIAAWFLASAAKAQGRSGVLFGGLSLLPPLAIAVFAYLYSRDLTVYSSLGSGE